MACNTVKKFTYDACLPSLGGIKSVVLADYKEDAVELTKTEGGVDAISTFIEGINWVHYPMKKNVASMTSTINNSAEGASYVTTELSMVFSRMEAQKRIAIQALAIGEVMALVEDYNGNVWFLGKDAPLTTTSGTGESGVAMGDKNAYSIVLTDTSLELPYTVDATLAKGIIDAAKGKTTSNE